MWQRRENFLEIPRPAQRRREDFDVGGSGLLSREHLGGRKRPDYRRNPVTVAHLRGGSFCRGREDVLRAEKDCNPSRLGVEYGASSNIPLVAARTLNRLDRLPRFGIR